MYHERKKVDPLVLDSRRGDEKLRSKLNRLDAGRANYDVDPSGDRFLMVSRGNVEEPTELYLVLNGLQELGRETPAGR